MPNAFLPGLVLVLGTLMSSAGCVQAKHHQALVRLHNTIEVQDAFSGSVETANEDTWGDEHTWRAMLQLSGVWP